MTTGVDPCNYFPRGLQQPDHGYRFALDSLLLACFAKPKKGDNVLELGTGCGVVALGFMLHNYLLSSNLRVTGLDIQPEMVRCARENSRILGLQYNCAFEVQDVRNVQDQSIIQAESCDLVLCNPPYRATGQGRQSPSQEKNWARFETRAGLQDFLQAAFFILKNKAHLAMIYPAQRLDFLLQELQEQRLQPKNLCLVHARNNVQASLALVQARKNGGMGLEIQPPIFLYTQDKRKNIVTRQTAEFCPFAVK